jgi:hypothetical protein
MLVPAVRRPPGADVGGVLGAPPKDPPVAPCSRYMETALSRSQPNA